MMPPLSERGKHAHSPSLWRRNMSVLKRRAARMPAGMTGWLLSYHDRRSMSPLCMRRGSQPTQWASRGIYRMTTAVGYLTGFANEHASEALPGALPVGRNSPQRCPYGLYAEQISGTAFTAPRADNRRTWCYRIRPSAQHRPFRRIDNGRLTSDFAATATPTPNQLRWNPLPIPDQTNSTDFISGLV